ncbi:MAG: Zn-ribbon domain-containing OB-fold protein, partial [Dehalococcoidia bacterium]
AYAVAYVDLDEGFRMLTNIVGVEDPTTEVKIGQRVRVEFEQQDEGDYPIPVFRPI